MVGFLVGAGMLVASLIGGGFAAARRRDLSRFELAPAPAKFSDAIAEGHQYLFKVRTPLGALVEIVGKVVGSPAPPGIVDFTAVMTGGNDTGPFRATSFFEFNARDVWDHAD